MAIEKPIQASAIRDEFAYYLAQQGNVGENTALTNPELEMTISNYRGVAVYYPNGRRYPDTDEPILASDGSIQNSYVIPYEGKLSWGDFYGGVGYFAEYPVPDILNPVVTTAGLFYSNYQSTTLRAEFGLDIKHSEIVYWRPTIHKWVVTTTWTWNDPATSGGYTQEEPNWQSVNTYTTTNPHPNLLSHEIVVPNGMADTYPFRFRIDIQCYSYDDSQVPYGGQLGGEYPIEESVNTITLEKDVVLTPYQPQDPAIRASKGGFLWNNTFRNPGHYSIRRRTYDGVVVSPPRPILSWTDDPRLGTNTGYVANPVTFDPAYGRSATNEIFEEWQFREKRAGGETNYSEWTTMVQEGTEWSIGMRDGSETLHTVSPRPAATSAQQRSYLLFGYLNANSLINEPGEPLSCVLDGFEFRLRTTARQTLQNPSEVLEVSTFALGPNGEAANEKEQGIELSTNIINVTPEFSMTGSKRSTVNGGTLMAKFKPTNMPTKTYYWRVVQLSTGLETGDFTPYIINSNPTSDFVDGISGSVTLADGQTATINIETVLDTDTSTEHFAIAFYHDALYTELVAWKPWRIIYGEPHYEIYARNTSYGGPVRGHLVYTTFPDKSLYSGYNGTVDMSENQVIVITFARYNLPEGPVYFRIQYTGSNERPGEESGPNDWIFYNDSVYGNSAITLGAHPEGSTGLIVSNDTRYAMNLTEDDFFSNDSNIYTARKFYLRAQDDSYLGGRAGVRENFMVTMWNDPNNTNASNYLGFFHIRVADRLERRLDVLNTPVGFTNAKIYTESDIDTYPYVTVKGNAQIRFDSTPRYHVSWGNTIPSDETILYRWEVKNPSTGQWYPIHHNYMSTTNWGSYAPQGVNSVTLGWNRMNVSPTGYMNLSNGKAKILGVYGLQLYDVTSSTLNYTPNISYNSKFRVRFATAPGQISGYPLTATTAEVSGSFTTENTYNLTGVTRTASTGSYYEGTFEGANPKLKFKTSRWAGKWVVIKTNDQGSAGWRDIYYPKFGPIPPGIFPPTNAFKYKIEKDGWHEIDLGSYFIDRFGWTESTQYVAEQFGGAYGSYPTKINAKVSVRNDPGDPDRIQIPYYSGFDGEAESATRSFVMKDFGADIRILTGIPGVGSTGAEGNPTKVTAPHDNGYEMPLDVSMTVTNAAFTRERFMSVGDILPPGAGWAIIKRYTTPDVDSKGNSNLPSAWFSKTGTSEYTDDPALAQNYFPLSFISNTGNYNGATTWADVYAEYPDPRASRDGYFRASYHARMGSYRTNRNQVFNSSKPNHWREGDAATDWFYCLNPTRTAEKPAGVWFPPKDFILRVTTWAPSKPDYAKGNQYKDHHIKVVSREKEPPTYRVEVSPEVGPEPYIEGGEEFVVSFKVVLEKGTWPTKAEDRMFRWEIINSSKITNPDGSAVTSPGGTWEVEPGYTYYSKGRAKKIETDFNGLVTYRFYEPDFLGGSRVAASQFTVKKYVPPATPELVLTGGRNIVKHATTTSTNASMTFNVSGGKPPYNWSGSAPGAQVVPSGQGPAKNVNYTSVVNTCINSTWSVTVTDSEGTSKTLTGTTLITTLNSCPELGGHSSPLTLTRNGPSSLTEILNTTNLTAAKQGIGVEGSATASGGVTPYKWTCSGPPEVSCAGNNQVAAYMRYTLNGEGQQQKSGTMTLTVTDAAGTSKSVSWTYSLSISYKPQDVNPCPTPDMPIRIGKAITDTVPAGDIKVGDTVWTQHEQTMEWGEYPVSAVTVVPDIDILEIVFDDDFRFTGSYSHKFENNGNWIEAKDLKVDDIIQGKAIKEINQKVAGDVIRITVNDAHTYVVGELLSHNKVPPCPTPDMPIMVGENVFVSAGELKVGDTVWTKHEHTGEWGNYTINVAERRQSKIIKVEFDDGFVFTGSPAHTFNQNGMWTRAENLAAGDVVQGKTVVSNTEMPDGEVIRFEIQDAHTYMVSDMWSHNVKAVQ